MKNSIMFLFAVCAIAGTARALTVTDISAHARYPWQSVIDVDFTVSDSKASDLFKVGLSATCDKGTKKLFARTFLSEPLCGYGRSRVSWDVGADYPGLKVDDLQVAVTVAPVNPAKIDALDVYMVIDLSSGPNSPRYPVHYTLTPPVLVPANDLVACAADPNRTTKLWLKRVKTNVFPLDGCDTDLDGDMLMKISPCYVSIFEVTQKQWNQVMGTWPSGFSNVTYRAARPVEKIMLKDIIGHANWPDSKEVSEQSFVGRVRSRSGLASFNITTEAQQESACRAGRRESSYGVAIRNKIASAIYNKYDYNEGPEEGTAIVGMFGANKWGFYDCCGNVAELCLDSYLGLSDLLAHYRGKYPGQDITVTPVEDPIGPPNNQDGKSRNHVLRGGAWDESTCATYSRSEFKYDNKGSTRVGIRVAVSPEWK